MGVSEWLVTFRKLFSVKYGALACLVLQNTFLVVFMRYSRTVHKENGSMYASSTAVAVMELLKFATCLCVILYEHGGNVRAAGSNIYEEVVGKPSEMMKLAVPSLVYTLQNNLLYFALSHLDAATYQVGYQTKILTTAVFSVILLKKELSTLQWLSLAILTIGVALTQLSTSSAPASHGQENTVSGFTAVFAAALTSGFAGVYFEMMLKGSNTSLWMRNIQMGITSIISGFLGIYFAGDLPAVLENGFFGGYSTVVWVVIVLQAIGGLVVAVVVKYADNILKGFAAALSIVTSFFLCVYFFDFHPTGMFLLGASLVGVSTWMYAHYPPKQKTNEEGLLPR